MKLSPLLKGLVLHLPLDEEDFNATTLRHTDKSAYCNHGIASSGVFDTDQMGQANRASKYNNNIGVNCGNATTPASVAYAFWFKPGSYPTAEAIFSIGTLNTIGNRTLYYYNGYWRFNMGLTGGSRLKTVYRDYLPVDTWHHVICEYDDDGHTLKMFIDSIQSGGAPSTAGLTPAASTDDFYVASYITGNRLIGSLSDFRMYDRILSADEKTLLYESYRPRLVI